MIKKLISSFNYASEGIVYTINTQRNMKIHIIVALTLLLSAMWLHFDKTESFFILIAIGMILSAEIFNTAVEKTIDLITQNQHYQLAKVAKDAAAGGVLMLTFMAVFIGLLVFEPYINLALSGGWSIKAVYTTAFFILEGFFIIIVTYIIKAFWLNKNIKLQPNVFLAIVLYLLALSNILISWSIYLVVIVMILLFLYFARTGFYRLLGFIQNFIISIGGFYILYWLFY